MRRTLDAVNVGELLEALKRVEPRTPIIVNNGYESDMGTLVGRSMLRLGGGNLFIFLRPECEASGMADKPFMSNEPPPSTEKEPLLTSDEMAVLDKLAEAWNAFVQLPKQHPMHNEEFANAIHSAQRLIMSRPVSRHYGWVKDIPPNYG